MKWQQAWHFLMVFWWVGILWRLRLPFLFRRRGGFAFVASWKILTWQKHLFSNFLSNSIRNAYVCLCTLYNVQVPLVENTTCEIKTSTKNWWDGKLHAISLAITKCSFSFAIESKYILSIENVVHIFQGAKSWHFFMKTMKYSQKKLVICDEFT